MSASTALGYLTALRHHLAASPEVWFGVFVLLSACLVVAVLGSRWAAAALVPLGVTWLAVNRQVEGSTLVVVTPGHGLTTSDLLAVAAFAVALWRLLPPLVAVLSGPPRRS